MSVDVHIVANELDGDQVLARLARALADNTGWSLWTKPRASADVNYFLPYLTLQPTATPIAAWFTHYDTSVALKISLWEDAQKNATIRTTCARQYAKILNAHLVTPPIDEQFTPIPQRGKLLGFSGYIYPGGRKGEQLAAQLTQYYGANRFIASGHGWPVTTYAYAWRDMPDFYRQLAVYICTASIEGIPMPPLEALACGVPVVVPKGVGMIDDWPFEIGVYRYLAGDIQSCLETLEAALKCNADPYDIAAQVSQFNEESWGQTHARIFRLT